MKQLLPLCSIPKLATRDGNVGALARIFIPFLGYWFASGQTFDDPRATIAQDQSMTFSGSHKPDTYQKAAGICMKGL